jgi:hypothetical protein
VARLAVQHGEQQAVEVTAEQVVAHVADNT